METKTPRRNRRDLNTQAEVAIINAVNEIEKVGADERLTEALTLMAKAKELVADYVDENPPKAPSITKHTEITSHEKACEVLGKNPSESTTTDQQITDVANAINKLSGFKADFKDGDQRKWRPYFLVNEGGVGFSLSCYVDWVSGALAGSRLCHYMSTEEEADHFGKQFLDLHRKHFFGE
jgi:hypothetical protein